MLFVVVIKFYDTELLLKREMMIDFMYTFENILGKMTTYYSFINFNIYIVKDKSSPKEKLYFW